MALSREVHIQPYKLIVRDADAPSPPSPPLSEERQKRGKIAGRVMVYHTFYALQVLQINEC